ncbi:MAG: TOBE domain-containing protein, partial [Pseudomonadota bacterium]
TEIALPAGYAPAGGKIELGIRPEFARLTSEQANTLPVRIRRVEDVGRHKIVRAECFGREINILAPEGAAIAADETRVAFDPRGINVYADDWRVAPTEQSEAA